MRPAGGSVRYSLGARPTSRACLVRQNQQRHGRPPHGAPLPRPGPATTPGRSMPVLIGHTARPVRRIFPSWQLLPAQLVVSYLRVNARDKTKSGVVRGCQLQLRTWWVCLPTAPSVFVDLEVVNDAISCPCFSCSSLAFFAPACCLASDQAPRYLASGRADPLASALLGQRISASPFLGQTLSGAMCDWICSWRRVSRSTRPAAGTRRGAGHLATSARCCFASRRSVAGLQSSSAAATSTGKPANC